MFESKGQCISGRFRNLERGIQPLAREAWVQIFGLPRPLPVTLEVRTEYLEATVGLVKRLEISKELIRECVTVPGCCCCMPLLHNYSKTSNSGPSEKRTTSLQRTAHLPPIDFTIELIHYEPPRSGHLSTPNNGH